MNSYFSNFGDSISLIDVIVRITCSIIIGCVIGIERERKNRPAGLRTHVLVCIAASMIALTEQQLIYEVSNLSNSAVNISLGRLTVGVISGIGFIGAGTIMMSKSRVVGLTTAASLWCTACLGLSCGMGYEIVSVCVSIVVVIVLKVLRIGEKNNLNRIVEVEYIAENEASKLINECFKKDNIKIHDTSISFHKINDVKYCSERFSIVCKNNEELNLCMSKLADTKDVTSVKIQNVL